MRSLDRLRQSYDEDSQVVIQDKRSPPRMLFSDTEILLEELPVGTRVVFPNPPVEELANWRAAIRWAINHPEGCDPLHAQLRPGMRVLIAIDDISLPLPPMRTPHAIRESKSYMEPKHSGLHASVDRIGRVIDQHVNVFHIETALNNKMFDGPVAFLGKREEDFTDIDRAALAGLRWTLSRTPRS